jgi:predicted nucleic acid-binding protein
VSVRRLVVDSSVALKWLKPRDEEHVAEAQALLDDHEAGRIAITAPTHLLLEVMNALWSHQATAGQVKRAAVLLRDLRVEFVEPDTMMLARAGELAVDHRITIYDAVFAALADHLDCELVTADRKLIESGACRMRGLAD